MRFTAGRLDEVSNEMEVEPTTRRRIAVGHPPRVEDAELILVLTLAGHEHEPA